VVEGVWIKDETNFFLLSPVFSFLQLPIVELFGVHFWSFRLVNTITSLLTILVGYLFLRKIFNKKTAIIFGLLLGFNFLYLVHNRIAMPETTQGLFFLLALVSLYYADKKKAIRLLFISGILSSLAVLTKTSAVIIYAIAVLFLLSGFLKNSLLSRKLNFIKSLKNFFFFFLSYASGAAIPILAWIYFLVIPNNQLFEIAKVSLIDRNKPSFSSLINPAYLENMIQEFLKGGEANLWLYFPILTLLALYFIFRFLKRCLNQQESRVETLLFIWLVLGCLNFLIVWYKPARFFVVYLIPLSVIGAYLVSKLKFKFQSLLIALYLMFNVFLITKYILINPSFSLRDSSNKLETIIGKEDVVGESLLHLDNSKSKTINPYFLMVMQHPFFPMDEYIKYFNYPKYLLLGSPSHREEEKKVQSLNKYERTDIIETNTYFSESRKVNLLKKVSD
jgi:4-amino-4-deoxy-L-arabinose transferase-like glycosyltransferase